MFCAMCFKNSQADFLQKQPEDEPVKVFHATVSKLNSLQSSFSTHFDSMLCTEV